MSGLWQQLQVAEEDLAQNAESAPPHVQVFQQGMAALKAMQHAESDLAQKEEQTLKAASAFIEALMYQPEWPEALLGLSYWLFLVGDSAAAIHYAERTLDQDESREDAQDLLTTLQSVEQLNTMQGNLQHLGDALGADTESAAPLLEVRRISLLLQVHHQLINLELDKELLGNEAQLYSRQASLETLVQMLVMQLEKGFPDTDALQQQIEMVSEDLARLEELKQAFLMLRQFRTEVQKYFSELTRMVIGIRMEQSPLGKTVTEVMKRVKKLDQRFVYLKEQLHQAPDTLQEQMRSLSGWEHVVQLYHQLKTLT